MAALWPTHGQVMDGVSVNPGVWVATGTVAAAVERPQAPGVPNRERCGKSGVGGASQVVPRRGVEIASSVRFSSELVPFAPL